MSTNQNERNWMHLKRKGKDDWENENIIMVHEITVI